jgi:hypothetical protein
MARRSWFGILFGGLWLFCGTVFVLLSLVGILLAPPADEVGWTWALVAAGFAMALAGGLLFHRGLFGPARDRRLLRSGIQVTATVTDLRRSPVTINRQERWHVHYRYEYTAGRTLEGRSRALPSDAVIGFRPGGQVLVKVDPRQPEKSLFVGVAP